MSGHDGSLVVIGLGNVLLRDDAVGVRVVEAMRSLADLDPEAVPWGTRLLDGGTLGLDLIRHLGGCRGLLLVDAVDLGLAPGAVTVLSGDDVTSCRGTAGAPALNGMAELVAVARLLDVWPPAVALVGVQVDSIGVGTELSPCLEGALPSAVEAAFHALGSLDAMSSGRGRDHAGTTRQRAGTTS
jgi:hydrogenase maturation protease